MAGDRKLGDMAIAFTILIGVFGIFIFVIQSFDTATNNSEVIGSQMLSASGLQDTYHLGNGSAVDPNQESLQSVTFDNNTFQAQPGQYIDTRGISQANIIASNNPSTLSSFFDGMKNLFPFKGSGYVWFIVFGIILISGIVLWLRFAQGSIKI